MHVEDEEALDRAFANPSLFPYGMQTSLSFQERDVIVRSLLTGAGQNQRQAKL